MPTHQQTIGIETKGHRHMHDLTVPIAEGRMILGTWQQVIHLECDIKPRSRKIIVTIRGDE